MSTVKDQHKTAKALPETGSENNNSNNGTLFGGLFAAFSHYCYSVVVKNKINNMINLTRSMWP